MPSGPRAEPEGDDRTGLSLSDMNDQPVPLVPLVIVTFPDARR